MEVETENVVARCHSVAALGGDLREDAVDALFGFLRDPYPLVRWQASKALAETIRALQEHGPLDIIRVRHSGRLLSFKELWRRLEREMRGGDARCRAAIADGLGLWGHPRAIPPLVSALKEDDDPLVRTSAADALGRIGDRQAADPLAEALEDESLWVRSAAGRALGQIAVPESVDVLRGGLVDAESLVRGSVAAALGHIATRKARRTLIQCLQNGDPIVRWYAARGLVEIGEVEDIAALEALFEDDAVFFGRSIGEMAQLAISAIRDRSRSPWHWLRRQFHVIVYVIREKIERG